MIASTPPSSKLTLYGFRERKARASSPRTKFPTAAGLSSVSLRIEYSCTFAWMYSANCTAVIISLYASIAESGLCITSVTWLARKCHQSVLVQVSGLVICSLQDSRASHGSFGSCDDNEVFSGNSE